MKIVLIGNYVPDHQQSMQRFAQMLHAGFTQRGIESVIWRPTGVFALLGINTSAGAKKWLGYIDKWILFPVALLIRVRLAILQDPDVKFHVCDHSNSPYLKYLPASRTVITCHDVLAIRGSMGYTDTYCSASTTGKVLQKWILGHLRKARRIAVVSQFSLDQLEDLTAADQALPQKDWRVIPNAFNAPFSPLPVVDQQIHLGKVGIQVGDRFILHIGSNQTRKNRTMLLDMVAQLGDQWPGVICYAGQPINEELRAHARKLGLEKRLLSVVTPDHLTLMALYSACEAFVFPSFSEGFGWPIIEAQACGAPVITSNVAPMPEVSGGAALLADPTRPAEFAEALRRLQNPSVRRDLIERGFKNCNRFLSSEMIEAYLNLHQTA